MVYLQKRKRFLKRFFIFAVLLIAVSFLVFFLNFFFSRFHSTIDLFQKPWSLILLATLVATALYKPFDRVILLLFQHVLFKKKMVRLRALQISSKILIHTLDLKELSNLIVNTIAEVMGQRIVILVLFDKLHQKHYVASSSGMPMNALKKMKFEEMTPLINFLREQKGLTERKKCLQGFSWPEVYEMSKGFELLAASVVLSISCEESWIGFLSLSGKNGGTSFSNDEVKALEDFGEAAGLALKNAIAMDELKQANEKLKDVQSKLLQSTKLAAIEQLAAGIAHEIHNPLTIISGRAQILLLKKNQQLDETALEEALKTIVKQNKRAADITRKLLMFSEPKSCGKDTVQFESVVDDTLALISYQTTLDEIAILKNISKNIPPFTGEINEIREIFLNLILNAVQAVEKKGTIQISIRYLEKESLIEIKIQDTGKGIRSEYIPRLFNPFFTTREGGVGLGLFITQQIVHRHHGSIHIESELGKGTVVVIHIPEKANPLAASATDPDPEEIHVE